MGLPQDRVPRPQIRALAAEPKPLIELDFGDAEFVVRQHADGMFTIDAPARLVLTAEQMTQIVEAIRTLQL